MVRRVQKNDSTSVEKWYRKNKDHGMSYYYEYTKNDRNAPPYPDRYSFGLWLAKDSPKLMYLDGLLGKICLGDDPSRVLVYNGWPMAQWNCEGFIKVGRFPTCSRRL